VRVAQQETLALRVRDHDAPVFELHGQLGDAALRSTRVERAPVAVDQHVVGQGLGDAHQPRHLLLQLHAHERQAVAARLGQHARVVGAERVRVGVEDGEILG